MAKSKRSYKLKKLNLVPAVVTTFDFPPEIEHVIFKWAARMFPRDAATLSVLCRRIQPFVESVMYESLLIASNPNFEELYVARLRRILPTLMSRPSTFFAAYVRNVCIRFDVPSDIVGIILSQCTAIRHLALRLGEESYTPTVSLTGHTLISLHIGRHTAEEMAQCGIVFPNLRFLTLYFFPPPVRVPPLDWIPSLKTVLLELEEYPLVDDDAWRQDIDTALSTTPKLQILILNASGLAMPAVKEYIRGRDIAKDIQIKLSNNLDMELEWRHCFRGRDRF